MAPNIRQFVTRLDQAGATTLLMSVLILFLASILVIGVSRTTVMEQRISANEVRARQAFEAAQTGLDHALDYATATVSSIVPGIDRNYDGSADTDTITASTHVAPAAYRFAYCDPKSINASCAADEVAVSCPDAVGTPICDYLDNGDNPVRDAGCNQITDTSGNPVTESESVYLKTPLIVACGWSDDGIGRQLIRQELGVAPALGGAPTAPLIAKGAINVQGSATITNYYNNLTIWSGGSLSNIGNSGKTYVRNPNLVPPAEIDVPPDPPPNNTGCSGLECYVKVTDQLEIGPDVISDDPTLNNLTDALMFKNFLGANDITDYRNNIATMDIAAGAVGILDDNGGVRNQSVVIEGNTTLPNGTIGTREQPVTLVINGDWEGGNTTVYGIVYVTGDIDVAGNPEVHGAVIVEGLVEGTGSLDVLYDPYAVANARNYSGRAALIPGTWRDW